MTTLLVVFASLVAYFGVGGAMAVRMLPRLWERGLARWRFESRFPELNDTGEKDAREGVVGMAVLWLFFWPVMVGIESLSQRVDAANPHARQLMVCKGLADTGPPCGVREECLAYGLTTAVGWAKANEGPVYGGLSPRRLLRLQRDMRVAS